MFRTGAYFRIMGKLCLHIGEFLPCQLYIIDLEPHPEGVRVIGQSVSGQRFERIARSEADADALLGGS